MDFLIFLSIVGILTGGLLAWFTKGGFRKLSVCCAVASLAIGGVVNLILAGAPASFSANYLMTAAFYFFWPWLLLLFLPCLVTAGLIFILKARRRRG